MRSASNTKGPRERYIYCIIQSKKEQKFGPIGIKGEEVYTIHYKDIAAVVSNSKEKNYEVLEEGIAHQKVVEAVMDDFCTIPMSFGQVPKSEEDVKGFLIENYVKLKNQFRKLENKIELGLKVLWKMDAIMREIVSSNDRIRILNKQISSKPKDSTYRLRIELGKMVAEELERRGKRVASEIYRRLDGISAESKMNKPIGDEMILNAAFLVEKNKEKEFDEMVNRVEEDYGDKVMLKFVISPPYNFVGL